MILHVRLRPEVPLRLLILGLGYFIWMNGNSPMAIQTDNPGGAT